MFPRRVKSCRIISDMFQCQVFESQSETIEQAPEDDGGVWVRLDHVALATWRYEKFNVEFKSSGR